jgi:hypothetical protein
MADLLIREFSNGSAAQKAHRFARADPTLKLDSGLSRWRARNSSDGCCAAAWRSPELPKGLIAQHTLSISNAGGFAPKSPLPGDVSAVDASLLLDVLLYIEYTVK